MKIFKNLEEWFELRGSLIAEVRLGFVPTMGNLHAGHLSLIHNSQQENSLTAVSIFINPTQFNNADDLQNYPRTLENDIRLLSDHNVDYCILPSVHDIYPDGYSYQIDEKQYSHLMEGLHRPGHFTGVLTVVMKLFNIVRPRNAYFGEKDYQQYKLLHDMATSFFLSINIKLCATVRDASGLALSSRNNRLSITARDMAIRFAQIFNNQMDITQIRIELEQLGIQVEYIEEHFGRRFAAVIIDGIRLIDNYIYPQPN